MEQFEIYSDISARTNGDIYVGVVGPVRTGKSTFIKKFMDKVVLNTIADDADKQRMIDELPQSGNGKLIMTTQPKFVPNKAVKVSFSNELSANVRLVDCVGYFVPGAEGNITSNGSSRMVKTPWQDEEMPLEKAAEIGTKKVIEEHSTIAVLVTTDGSFTDINRLSYVNAEERVAQELTTAGKPFVIVLNTVNPNAEQTQKLVSSLQEKYNAPVCALDVEKMTDAEFNAIFEKVLYEFPVRKINIDMPKWVRALPVTDELVESVVTTLSQQTINIVKMKDYTMAESLFSKDERFNNFMLDKIDLATGTITYKLEVSNNEFYNLLSRQCGVDIADDFYLMSYMKHLTHAKQEYDKIKMALQQVKETGYGIVTPTMEELTLEEPQIVTKGGSSGVKLKASAPSLHIMRVDVETEVCPALGNIEQSQAFAEYMLGEFENNPQNIWNTNMFGKSLSSLVKEGIDAKVNNIPEEAQVKMRKTLTKIVNERKGGIICILL